MIKDEPERHGQPATARAPDSEVPGLHRSAARIPIDHFGTSVFLRGWHLDNGHPHAILIVHDLGEQADLYADTASLFLEEGYSVYAFDLRGHGRSGRRIGHAPTFRSLVHDLLQVVAWVRHKQGGQNPIVLGQGIGALITLEFSKKHGSFCRAMVLSAPSLELAQPVPWLTRLAIRILAELWPSLRLPAAVSPRFCRELQTHAVDGFQATLPTSHLVDQEENPVAGVPRLTAALAHQLVTAINNADVGAPEIQGDVLILCPLVDDINEYRRVRKSVALHTGTNIEILDLDGIGHWVFTDSQESRRGAVDVILPWLARIEKQATKTQSSSSKA